MTLSYRWSSVRVVAVLRNAADALSYELEVEMSGEQRRRWSLEPSDRTTGSWPSLTTALRELKESVPSRPIDLTLLLMPPLTRARRVVTERLEEDELLDLLEHEVGRLAPLVGEPETAVIVHRRPVEGGQVAFAAWTSTSLLHACAASAETVGIRLRRIVPAYSAWWRASRRDPRPTRHDFETGGITERLTREVDGDVTFRRERGPVQAESHLTASHAALVTAARGASGFRGAEERARRRTVVTRRIRSAFVGSALLAASTPFLILWGNSRELNAIAQVRAAIAPSVNAAFAAREEVDALSARAQLSKALRDSAAAVPRLLSLVLQSLPQDVELTSLRLAGDTVALSGRATSASGVFEALGRVAGARDLRATSPISQVSGDSMRSEGETFGISFLFTTSVARTTTP